METAMAICTSSATETATVIGAVCTFLMAVFTAILAWETFKLGQETHKSSLLLVDAARESTLRQIGVTTWLALEPRFDSKEMKAARRKLAGQLYRYDPVKHDEISEEVLELFESVGTVYNQGLLDTKLAYSSFSYYANHWWKAAKPYVDRERMNKGDDKLFDEFEESVKKMCKGDSAITSKSLDDFLNDEMRLKTD